MHTDLNLTWLQELIGIHSKYAALMEQLAGAGFQFIGKPIWDNRFNVASQKILYGVHWLTRRIMYSMEYIG